MRILSVDPGYERLGIALVEGDAGNQKLLYSECFQTSAKNSHGERLFYIHDKINQIIKEHKPDQLAIETLFFNVNQKTAIKVAESRGVVLAVAAKNNLAIREFSPQAIKIAVTGHGNSGKDQVTAMIKNLVRMEKSVKLDDEYDAIAIGITCLATPENEG